MLCSKLPLLTSVNFILPSFIEFVESTLTSHSDIVISTSLVVSVIDDIVVLSVGAVVAVGGSTVLGPVQKSLAHRADSIVERVVRNVLAQWPPPRELVRLISLTICNFPLCPLLGLRMEERIE